MSETAEQVGIGRWGKVAQDLRQVGRADLAGSAGAVGERGELQSGKRGHRLATLRRLKR
jgi:hypothetical protein